MMRLFANTVAASAGDGLSHMWMVALREDVVDVSLVQIEAEKEGRIESQQTKS